MKFLSLLLIFLNLGIQAQDSILPTDQTGLIRFEEEVKLENAVKDALFNNAVKFASSVKKENKRKSDIAVNHGNHAVSKKGSFFVYTQGLLTPQIHGEISYNVSIQVFDEGYKYSFTDFVFNYYQRNRYGKYAPVSGKKKALEEEKFAGMQKQWHGHKEFTKEYIEKQIEILKENMASIPAGANTAQFNDDETHEY